MAVAQAKWWNYCRSVMAKICGGMGETKPWLAGGGRPVGLKWFGQPHEIRLIIITLKIDRTWVVINLILSYTYIAYNLDPYVQIMLNEIGYLPNK